MAETVFTGKKIKEFPLEEAFTNFGLAHAKIPWLFKHFLMGNRPGNTGYGQCQDKQRSYLLR